MIGINYMPYDTIYCPHDGTLLGIAISHEKRENGKFVDEKFLTGKSDEKNGKLSSLK